MSILQSIETVASLQPHSIILYKSFPRRSKPADEQAFENLEKGKNGDYNGYLSAATARKIKKCISAWLLGLEANMTREQDAKNEYYPTFLTLTLPALQSHSDNVIKRDFLNRFIIRLKKAYSVQYYFWRAEPQQNGNIHFHILVDKYIPWRLLRFEWNKILDEHGYIDAYRKEQESWHSAGFKVRKDLLADWPESAQKEAYKVGMKENWSNPNTTDIHAIENLDSISAYVVKYVTKKKNSLAKKEYSNGNVIECVSERPLDGRIWGCSDELRELGHYKDTYVVDSGANVFSNQEMTDYVKKVELEVGVGNVYEDEYIKVIRLKNKQDYYLSKYSKPLHYRYRDYYKDIFTSLYKSRQVDVLV